MPTKLRGLRNYPYSEIAKDVAKVILEKSSKSSKVVDVLLYGSTLKKHDPNDIDLLIIHEGTKLSPFTPYGLELKVDEPIGPGNARESPVDIFKKLSYKSKRKSDSVLNTVIKMIGFSNYMIRDYMIRDYIVSPIIKEKQRAVDIELINHVFDINVLHAALLKPSYDDDAIWNIRDEAIYSCKDMFFWHKILSKGRIYDRTKNGFAIKVKDKYPGALALFPSK